MDEAVGQHRLSWQTARIDALQALTPRVMRVVLRPDRWVRPRPGQHLDVRLTAEDGYQAQRSYSLLSPPQRTGLYELGIERLDEAKYPPGFTTRPSTAKRLKSSDRLEVILCLTSRTHDQPC